MKRKLLCIMLVASLILSVVMPATALAAKGKAFEDFSATGGITGITPGEVLEAGNSGRWRVLTRDVVGDLTGSVTGAFVMTYKANVLLATQAGNFHGTLEVDSYTFKVRSKIQPLQWVSGYIDSDTQEWVPLPFGMVFEGVPGFWLPRIDLEGSWILDGTQGNGTFSGWAIFIPDNGHVGMIFESSFTMDGKIKQ